MQNIFCDVFHDLLNKNDEVLIFALLGMGAQKGRTNFLKETGSNALSVN